MKLNHEISRFPQESTLENASTPPASWYTWPEFFELEKQTVFRKHWLFVGRTDQLREPGDYFSGMFLDWPYLVTKDDEGELRAYYNVCSHHGTCVASGEGKATQFVCPYHGWTYGLGGDLKKAPRAGAMQSLKDRNLNLKPIAVDTFGPFVALHFGEPTVSLKEELESLHQSFVSEPFAELQFVRRLSYTIDCNWKVFVDNYLDGGYHVPHMHPGLNGQLDFGSYQSNLGSSWSMQSCKTAPSDEDESSNDFGERVGEHADYAWVHPNFMVNRYGRWMDTNTVIPLARHRCLVVFDYYYQGTPDEAFLEKSMVASDQVQQEDIEICHLVQRGLGSGAYDQGVYAPRFEAPMFHFHRLLHRDFQR